MYSDRSKLLFSPPPVADDLSDAHLPTPFDLHLLPDQKDVMWPEAPGGLRTSTDHTIHSFVLHFNPTHLNRGFYKCPAPYPGNAEAYYTLNLSRVGGYIVELNHHFGFANVTHFSTVAGHIVELHSNVSNPFVVSSLHDTPTVVSLRGIPEQPTDKFFVFYYQVFHFSHH